MRIRDLSEMLPYIAYALGANRDVSIIILLHHKINFLRMIRPFAQISRPTQCSVRPATVRMKPYLLRAAYFFLYRLIPIFNPRFFEGLGPLPVLCEFFAHVEQIERVLRCASLANAAIYSARKCSIPIVILLFPSVECRFVCLEYSFTVVLNCFLVFFLRDC